MYYITVSLIQMIRCFFFCWYVYSPSNANLKCFIKMPWHRFVHEKKGIDSISETASSRTAGKALSVARNRAKFIIPSFIGCIHRNSDRFTASQWWHTTISRLFEGIMFVCALNASANAKHARFVLRVCPGQIYETSCLFIGIIYNNL